MESGDKPLEMDWNIRRWVLPQLSRIVSEHTALLQNPHLRYFASDRVTFVVHVSPEEMSLLDINKLGKIVAKRDPDVWTESVTSSDDETSLDNEATFQHDSTNLNGMSVEREEKTRKEMHVAGVSGKESTTQCVSLNDGNISEIFDLYVNECCQQGAFFTAVSTALSPSVKKTDHVKHLIANHLTDLQFEETLSVLSDRDQWGLILELLKSRPETVSRRLVKDTLDFQVYSEHPLVDACMVELVSRVTDLSLLHMVVQMTVINIRLPVLKSLLTREDLKLAAMRFSDQQTGLPLTLLDLAVKYLAEGRDDLYSAGLPPHPREASDDIKDMNNILLALMEAGFLCQVNELCQHVQQDVPFLQRPTALISAATYCLPDLVHLLLGVGATTLRELFLLKQHLPAIAEKRSDLEDDEVWSYNIQKVQELILDAARDPLSLQTLCVNQMARLVGCGPSRERRVEELPLPIHLKDRIRFKKSLKEFRDCWQL